MPDLAAIHHVKIPVSDVHAWADHLASIDQKHGGIVTGHHGGTVLVGLHAPTA